MAADPLKSPAAPPSVANPTRSLPDVGGVRVRYAGDAFADRNAPPKAVPVPPGAAPLGPMPKGGK